MLKSGVKKPVSRKPSSVKKTTVKRKTIRKRKGGSFYKFKGYITISIKGITKYLDLNEYSITHTFKDEKTIHEFIMQKEDQEKKIKYTINEEIDDGNTTEEYHIWFNKTQF